ncbi:hypothetical protein ACIRRH_00555 [Kitasatospora sp. NPDC101235]|uniref:hypothetical protein n=1 Tax=Kitasatospora sp. NPDC101235 TaxID=3364101 RepID=UPI0038193771
MTADDRVTDLIAEAARRRAANAARRARLGAARRAGLDARHHLKLIRLNQRHNEPPADTTEPEPPDAA